MDSNGCRAQVSAAASTARPSQRCSSVGAHSQAVHRELTAELAVAETCAIACAMSGASDLSERAGTEREEVATAYAAVDWDKLRGVKGGHPEHDKVTHWLLALTARTEHSPTLHVDQDGRGLFHLPLPGVKRSLHLMQRRDRLAG